MPVRVEATAWVSPEFEAFAERRATEIFNGMEGSVPDAVRQAIARYIIEEARMLRLINVKIRFEHELYPPD